MLGVGAGCSALDGPLGRGDVGGDRIAWRIAYDSGQYAPTVGVDGARVYARTGLQRLTAFDLATRRRLWDATSGDDRGDVLFQVPNVLAAGGLAVFGAYRGLTAVDGATGQRRWYWEPSRGGVVGQGSPVVTDGAAVYAATRQPAMLYAVALGGGAERWVAALGSDLTSAQTASNPVVAQGTVMVGLRFAEGDAERGAVVAIDATTGRERWRFAVPPLSGRRTWNGNGGLAVDGGVAVASTGDDGRVFGLSLADGRVLWQAPGVVAYDIRPVATTGGVALAGSTTGPLVAYDADTGEERWRVARAQFAGSMNVPFIASGSEFLLTDLSGDLFAYDVRSGTLRWRFQGTYSQAGQRDLLGPVTADARSVLAVAFDGLYAFRR